MAPALAQAAVRRLPIAPPAPIWGDSLVVTFAFRCNLACTFCMVEDVLESPYPGVALTRFRELVERRDRSLDGIRRIVLSGGEVTTSKELPEYVAVARSLPGVEHVRIQTNAIALGNRELTRALVAAGADEFFVSFHAADAESCDAITRRSNSFARILEGMKNVVESGAALITNTVIVRDNVGSLPAIVDTVAPFRPKSLEFWNYWPRVREHASKFVVPVGEARPFVIDALLSAQRHGLAPVVRWFPRCLLPAELKPYHDDGQPRMLIEEQFWEREPRYDCLWAGVCEEFGSKNCSGLSAEYVELHGWEEDLLAPLRSAPARTDAWPANEHPLLRNLIFDAGPRRTQVALAARWLADRELPFGAEIAGFWLETVQRSRFRDSVRLHFGRSDASFDLVLAKSGARVAVVRVLATPELAANAEAVARAVEAALAKHPTAALP